MEKILLKKIRYLAAYRGSKEAEMILGKFLEFYLEKHPGEIIDLIAFLEQEDENIFAQVKKGVLPLNETRPVAEIFATWFHKVFSE